jgi:hypothetical protein
MHQQNALTIERQCRYRALVPDCFANAGIIVAAVKLEHTAVGVVADVHSILSDRNAHWLLQVICPVDHWLLLGIKHGIAISVKDEDGVLYMVYNINVSYRCVRINGNVTGLAQEVGLLQRLPESWNKVSYTVELLYTPVAVIHYINIALVIACQCPRRIEATRLGTRLMFVGRLHLTPYVNQLPCCQIKDLEAMIVTIGDKQRRAMRGD